MGSVHVFEFPPEPTISLRESMLRFPTGGITMRSLVDPKHIRMDQRVRAGRFEVYGVELGPIEKTLAAARHLVDYRAGVTVEAIGNAMDAAGR